MDTPTYIYISEDGKFRLHDRFKITDSFYYAVDQFFEDIHELVTNSFNTQLNNFLDGTLIIEDIINNFIMSFCGPVLQRVLKEGDYTLFYGKVAVEHGRYEYEEFLEVKDDPSKFDLIESYTLRIGRGCVELAEFESDTQPDDSCFILYLVNNANL